MNPASINPDPAKRKGVKGRLLAAQQSLAEREAARAAKNAKRNARKESSAPVLSAVQTKMAMCHSDREAHAHGLCEPCYSSVRWTGRVPTGLSDEAAEAVAKIVHLIPRAKNRAERYAQSDEEALSAQTDETPERGTASALHDVAEATSGGRKVVAIEPVLPTDVNLDDPAQRKHLVTCILLRGMNFEAGVCAAYPSLKPSEAATVAFHVQQDQSFASDIQEAASQRGVSDQDKQAFLGILWRYASSVRPQDYQDRGTALRLLGKVFLPENVRTETPQRLPISGLEQGLESMGFDKDTLAKVAAVPVGGIPDLTAFGADEESEDEL